MKAAPFKYYAPQTVEEATHILATRDNARVLAGGQSLVPMMNLRVLSPEHLVDLNRVHSLAGIKEAPGSLIIGAMTRQREIELSALVRRDCPVLGEVVDHVGHQQTRNRGTLGGSLCHMDPGAELPVAACLLDAILTVESEKGSRQIKFDDFAVGYLTNSLDAAEILTSINVPRLKPGSGWAFMEFSRRPADLAIASAAVIIEFDAAEHINNVRVALGGIGYTPVRLRRLETSLVGQHLDDAALNTAADEAYAQPTVSQGENSADYRSHLCAVLLKRALKLAHQRSKRTTA